MVTSYQADARADAAAKDLGPLAWVLDETRKSIEAASKSLKRFAHESQAALGVDIASVDASRLRLARQQLHQAVGALEMVEQATAARMVRAMEAAVQQLVQHPEKCNDAAATTLERAGFALVEYLEGQLGERARPALGLFAQYRQVQELAGAERIHPADLWDGVWHWADPATLAPPQPLTYGADTRGRIDLRVLKMLRRADAHAAGELSDICLALAGSETDHQPAVFWRLCGGFFEALGHKLVPMDLYVKRAVSGVLLQYTALARGEKAVPERLALDLLFFCAQAQPADATAAPALAAVRQAWELERYPAVDYEQSAFGLYDPAVLAQARRRIDAVKENWSALAGGDLGRLRPCVNQFELVCGSLDQLHEKGKSLSEALRRVAAQVEQSGQAPSPELAMETATAVLFLEASFADFQPGDVQFTSRMQQLADRLDSVRTGTSAPALEPWMEELYRGVSDRQTMGTVVGELRVTLGEVEQHLDQFFRNPADKSTLTSVADRMSQMRGVLSVLGLDQAVLAVSRMQDAVGELVSSEAPVEEVEHSGLFERIGNSLGALGFQIDMMGYQPVLARKLFVYDAESGELRHIAGRLLADDSRSRRTEAGGGATESAAHELAAPLQAAAAGLTFEKPSVPPQQPALQASAGELPAASTPLALADGEDDLLDIFLEEAREVVRTGQQALQALKDEPGDLEQQTTLRRAFHTLKGSSRMVGLTEFGEAAWAMEQMLNAWLAEQKPMRNDLRGLAGEAVDSFGRWIDDIAGKRADGWRAAPFRTAADALRLQGQRLSLAALLESAASATAAPAAPAAPLQALASLDLPDLELHAPHVDTDTEIMATEPMPLDTVPMAIEHEATGEPGVKPAPVNLLDFDLSDFGQVAPQDAAAPRPAAVAPELLDIDMDRLDLIDVGQGSQSERPGALEVAEAGDLSDDLLAEFQPPAPIAHEIEPAIQPAAEMTEAATSPAADDYKQVGDLRISTPLYNVYLNEADEWSRELVTALSEWALELDHPVPELAIARAHSLAGTSATVGFNALSELARATEHALQRLADQPRGTPAQAQTLSEAAEEIRRVLYQFAAGILKLPSAEILAAVHEVEPTATGPAALEEPSVPTALARDPERAPSSSLMAPLSMALPAHAAPPAAVTEATRHHLSDDIHVVDAVDPDLFPIFEEEAQELLPRLSASLRHWAGHPEDRAARAEAMRALHTLKGSARLAGAMRLGEMAHRTESAIEMIGSEHVHADDLQPLLDDLDEMMEVFHQIQVGGVGLASVGAEQKREPPQVELAAPVAPELLLPDAPAAAPVASAVPVVRGDVAEPAALSMVTARVAASQVVRVRSQLLDRLVNQAGEVLTSRTRLESEVSQLRNSLTDLTGNLDRLRQQLRDVELQAETQMQSRMAQQSRDSQHNFDPLEFDRFTRMQELTRMMAESVNDVATVQRSLQASLDASESDLAAQARQSRELQRDLLRTRMVEFESISERLYRVIRLASKEVDKQVRLDIVGGSIEVDRGILERMTAAFEHLLRNSVVHGIETPAVRSAAGKDPVGTVTISVQQAGNDVSIEFRDDGAGLNLASLHERALQQGLITADQQLTEAEQRNLVLLSGLSTAAQVTELAGRGVGMDVVRTEVQAVGGRLEIDSTQGKGAAFRLVLPLTTAVTHVVMVRADNLVIGVPSNLIQVVRRVPEQELNQSYQSGNYRLGEDDVPFHWAGALLQSSERSSEPRTRTTPVVVLHSAAQRVAMHVDEVLGNQEVVVKALGPQLARLPGLVAITALASGAVALIYNPVALAAVYGPQARALVLEAARQAQQAAVPAKRVAAARSDIPLVLVVDDSITVRRVTQRLLQREGYRVALAADGLQGLEQLQAERPAVVLSDIEMPRMDGFDFVRNIRADDKLRDLPVIMITSRIAAKHRDHARELGIDHYLGKPYSEDDLLKLIKDYTHASAPQ